LKEFLTKPDNHRLSWHSYFALMAIVTAQRSPDPNTKVGCIIVGPDKKIKSTGYNGLVKGISSDAIDWSREGNPLDTKYPYVIHAEANAILNATTSLKDCSVYLTLYSCNECAKLLIQSGISRVYYLDNPYRDTWQCKAAQRMFELTDIQVRELRIPPEEKEILDNITNTWNKFILE